jgi:hypothetical protein
MGLHWEVWPESSRVGACEGMAYCEAEGGGGGVAGVSRGETRHFLCGCVPEWVVGAIRRSKDSEVIHEVVTPEFGAAVGEPFGRP